MRDRDDGEPLERAMDDGNSLEHAMKDFLAARPQLFGIAYRMLGSVADAEDILQETWLRWQRTDRSAVREPAAFLTTVTTRLAVNSTRSARRLRETYVGPWLPEPVDTRADPQLGAERAEAVDLAVLLLLERLNPVERAAYVLREAFDYPYGRIAGILETSEPNTRQLVSRARKHLKAARREPVSDDAHRRLLETFLEAARGGTLTALEDLLAEDVVSYADGGGMRGASRVPVAGRERVARYLVAFAPRFWPRSQVRWVEANGRPAVLVRREGHPVALLCADVSDRGIERLMWVMNPAKLAPYVSAVAG
ncbi:RNA polymerase sigma-70 factor [Streptomyces sp. NPDC046859]|uniref:RNA polymerase sigma-70 factor n=1 Tax=Streptomyces sp. NPDC046859 TaxID=3155734 RepID=UPI0034052526